MTIQQDPEENETRAIMQYAGSLEGRSILEIGCGDGRMTWRYADNAAHVTGIDPDPVRYPKSPGRLPKPLASQSGASQYRAGRFCRPGTHQPVRHRHPGMVTLMNAA